MFRVEMDRHSNGIADFERVKRFVIADRLFCEESGELTPTFKAKRQAVAEAVAERHPAACPLARAAPARPARGERSGRLHFECVLNLAEAAAAEVGRPLVYLE